MKKSHLRRPLAAAILATLLAITLGLVVVACGGSDQTSAWPTSDTKGSGASATSEPSSSPAGAGESGSIVFSGLIDFPMTFTALDMDYMDWTIMTADHPELGSTEYEGVSLSDLSSYVGVQPAAATLVITAADGSTSQVAIADIPEDALLALGEDDSLNMVMPGMAAEAWIDDVVRMEFR